MINPNDDKELCFAFVSDSPDPIKLDEFKDPSGNFGYLGLPHVADKVGKPMAFWDEVADEWTLSNDWTQLASWEEVLKFFDPEIREQFEFDFLLSKSDLQLK